jgi:hypothetical protein
MQLRRPVPGDRDQAETRVVLPDSGDRADAVEAWHMEVDHDSLRRELLDELDCFETVPGDTDDGEARLLVDHRPEGLDEPSVVVCQDDLDAPFARRSP